MIRTGAHTHQRRYQRCLDRLGMIGIETGSNVDSTELVQSRNFKGPQLIATQICLTKHGPETVLVAKWTSCAIITSSRMAM
jgi:hypothetical protein